ncbi:MAG: PAS domain S-box protein [Desulfocapsaceae bacterium]|nr:PAS domain S-box protein [Desulfocapsaceae bacterium]
MSEKPTYEELSRKLQEYEEVFQDLSKLRKAEEALQNSEKKYRCLVESLERDYILYSHDMDGNFTYLSPSVVNVLGYSQDEFMGHYADYITDSPINKDVEEHTSAGLRGEKQEPYEAEFWHKNGTRIHLRVTEVPLLDDNGNVLGIEGIVQDITKLKQAEVDRESAIKKLEKALSEIKTLRGILPLCSFCKKIRDDKGYWEQVDVYINKYSEADISHSVCPECLKKHYPDWE